MVLMSLLLFLPLLVLMPVMFAELMASALIKAQTATFNCIDSVIFI
jgi:hypothetical protein